jgi:glutathione S-transferase
MASAQKAPEFLRLNPAGKVPVLVDGDLVIPESAAIILYLADKFPEKGLMPAEARLRAEVYRWIMFAVTELEGPLWRITLHSVIYPQEKRSSDEIARARDDFVAMAAVLNGHMEGRRFIVGGSMSAADCVTAYLMDWANEQKLLDDLPNLLAYFDFMYSRPSSSPRIADAFATENVA